MQITVAESISDLNDQTVLVVPYLDGDDLSDVEDMARLGGDRLRGALQRKEVRPTLYDTTLFHGENGSPSLLLIGAGKRDELDALRLKRVFQAASRHTTGRGYHHVAALDRGVTEPEIFAQAAVQGSLEGAYNSAIKKTDRKDERSLDTVALVSRRSNNDLNAGAHLGQFVADAATITRDLVNLPPNDLTPTVLAERAQTLAGEHHLTCTVLDESAMRGMGMGSLLGVAAGSEQPPRVIKLSYGPEDAPIKLALVGKGLTFDSGGLSLKTAQGMETMKSDMGGAAAVIGGIMAASHLDPSNIQITAYVGATENMPGGGAMRPGDVLTALNGETIEVLNTDAEGRLVLADLLTFASREGATHIVDFATLTGGAVVALGTAATLATGRPMEWVRQVVQAADTGLDRAWAMPMYDEYRRAMDSDVADIKNTGGREGSALTAAAFLGDFVDVPNWCHMDIAGTAFAHDPSPYRPGGGTGEGVGTIVALVRQLTSGTSS